MNIKRSQIAIIAITLGLAAILGATAETAVPSKANDPNVTACVSSAPCIEYDNNGSGLAIRGVGLTGNGIGGATKQNSTSALNGKAGLIGFDVSTSGAFNSGVKGISIRGVGLTGVTSSGTAVIGTSTSGTGVLGSGNIGIEGENTPSASSDAIFAKGFGGRLFRGNNSKSVDVFTVDDLGSSVQSGSSTIGGATTVGGNATIIGNTNIGGNAFVGGFSVLDGGANIGSLVSTALYASNNTDAPVVFFTTGDHTSAGDGLRMKDSVFNLIFDVDDIGDVRAHAFTANLTDATGQKVVTYTPRTSEPSIEDFGEAQLSAGAAYVRIENRFANTMARGATYLVFITPEGMTQGTLCVTERTPAGFTVRENQGGRSSVPFAYRIVARPFGDHGPRLPAWVDRAVDKHHT